MDVFSDINVVKNGYISNNTEKQKQKYNMPVEAGVKRDKTALAVKAGICLSAIAIGGILYKNRLSSPQFKQLAEKIEFKHCETIDEAINFGKNVLGVKKYKGFKETDLDVVNWINEGLVQVSNAARGKIAMPQKIVYESFGNQQGKIVGGWMNAEGTMKISKEYVSDVKSAIKYYVGENATSIETLNKSQNFSTWVNAWISILKTSKEHAKQVEKQAHTSTFSVINHEMGHLQHCVNTKSNLADLAKNNMELFEKSTDIAKNVSNYAATCPTEFVAECFSKMADGIKLDDKTMELYKQLGGYVI